MNLLFAYPAEIPEEISEEINKLHKNTFLFGSRYMAQYFGYLNSISKETDWDFAFPYEGSEQVETEKATSLGWVEKPTEKYKDGLHFITWEKIVGEHKVQMCSKINLSEFKSTFERIPPEFYWKYLHKSSDSCLPKETQTDIFNLMYSMKGCL
jgi:hypothetical protein